MHFVSVMNDTPTAHHLRIWRLIPRDLRAPSFSSWWFQRFLEFSPRSLGKWSNLTSIFFNCLWLPWTYPCRPARSDPPTRLGVWCCCQPQGDTVDVDTRNASWFWIFRVGFLWVPPKIILGPSEDGWSDFDIWCIYIIYIYIYNLYIIYIIYIIYISYIYMIQICDQVCVCFLFGSFFLSLVVVWNISGIRVGLTLNSP